jgi:hypothetical protein
MKVIGIEIDGKNAVFTSLESDAGTIATIDTKIQKVNLSDHTNSGEIKRFRDLVIAFFNEVDPDQIAIIKRGEIGKFAAGSVTFKIEGIIQTYPNLDVQIIPLPTIKAHERKYPCTVKPKFNYQQNSCLLANYLLR